MPYNKFANILLFQAGWFATVYMAAQQWTLLASICVFGFVILHLVAVKNYRSELIMLVFVSVLGFTIDSMNLLSGVISVPKSAVAPLWLVGLWALFSCTINYSLAWLRNKTLLAVVLGSVAGPLSYYAGEKIGALMIRDISSLLFLAVIWAVVFPIMLLMARKVDRYSLNSEKHG